jgi:hypothetical protein
MSTAGKVCAESASHRRKLSRQVQKRIRYITARRETISQLPTGTNFIPLLLSCEKWRLAQQIPSKSKLFEAGK